MPERTIFCPNGCPEEYLERAPWEGIDKKSKVSRAQRSRLSGKGTHYICEECGWEALYLGSKERFVSIYDGKPTTFEDGVADYGFEDDIVMEVVGNFLVHPDDREKTVEARNKSCKRRRKNG